MPSFQSLQLYILKLLFLLLVHSHFSPLLRAFSHMLLKLKALQHMLQTDGFLNLLDLKPNYCSLIDGKSQELGRKTSMVSSALPETAASVAIAATIVGAAATLLVRRSKASEVTELRLEVCGDCAGSGICSECNGEGFVLKKLSEESAEKARMAAKTMATRYTAGLPKKWSYCTKCSSSRSCSTCGGRGKLSY